MKPAQMPFDEIHSSILKLLSGPLMKVNREYFKRLVESDGTYGQTNENSLAEHGDFLCHAFGNRGIQRYIAKPLALLITERQAVSNATWWLICLNEDGSPCWDYSSTQEDVEQWIPSDTLNGLYQSIITALGRR